MYQYTPVSRLKMMYLLVHLLFLQMLISTKQNKPEKKFTKTLVENGATIGANATIICGIKMVKTLLAQDP